MFFNTLVAYYYIMKNIFFSLLFILFLSAFDGISQTKLLSIQDAVSKGRTSLAPKRLQNLSFIPGSSQLSYLDKNHLFVLNTKNGKEINHLSKNELNAALIKANMDSVSVLEGILFKNENDKQHNLLRHCVPSPCAFPFPGSPINEHAVWDGNAVVFLCMAPDRVVHPVWRCEKTSMLDDVMYLRFDLFDQQIL